MFTVGDTVTCGLRIFKGKSLVISKIEAAPGGTWISVEGYPQDGTYTFRDSNFKLVKPLSLENK